MTAVLPARAMSVTQAAEQPAQVKMENVIISLLDIDECATNQDNCDGNATCTNTIGSFTCACYTGYTGSGVSCTGMLNLVYVI